MAKFHPSPTTGKMEKCNADPSKPRGRACKFGADDHIEARSLREANAFYEVRLAQEEAESGNAMGSTAVGTGDTVDRAEIEAAGVKRSAKEAPKKRPIRLTEQEKALRAGNKELIKQTLAMRAELGDITFEDANPERAARRLQESIDFADSRGNDNLMNMLRTAKVLPSGAFKTADGRRVNTDRQLLLKSVVDDVDRQRGEISRALSATFRPGETAKGVFKGEAGSFSVSVAPKLDKEAFEKLPDDIRAACSTEQPTISSERAREVLSADEYDAISSRSQVMNYILAKAKVSGEEERPFYRGTGNERAAAAAYDLHSLYADTHRERGKVRDLKSELDEGNDAIKSSVAGLGGNVFVPARSQLNGGLVTERTVMNKKKATELLSKERLDSIMVMSPMPDADKARKVLSPDQFATIFEAPTVSIRALESK